MANQKNESRWRDQAGSEVCTLSLVDYTRIQLLLFSLLRMALTVKEIPLTKFMRA